MGIGWTLAAAVPMHVMASPGTEFFVCVCTCVCMYTCVCVHICVYAHVYMEARDKPWVSLYTLPCYFETGLSLELKH